MHRGDGGVQTRYNQSDPKRTKRGGEGAGVEGRSVKVQVQRSTGYSRALQRASEGAAGVQSTTLLLWAVDGKAGERVSRTQESCEEVRNRWEI